MESNQQSNGGFLGSQEKEDTKSITKSLLCIILDLNFDVWMKKAEEISAHNSKNGSTSEVPADVNKSELYFDCIKKMCFFINAHLLQSSNNEVAVYGSFPHEALFLGPKNDEAIGLKFTTFSSNLMKSIEDLYSDEKFQEAMASESKGYSKIGSALKKSSCFINSWNLKNYRPDVTLNSRIMIFQASPDNNDDYYSVVNSIFACQKNSVVIDSIMFNKQDSILLQQCSYLTNGIYTKTLDREEIVNFLFMDNYCLDSQTRKSFNRTFQEELDLRVSCSCCNKIINYGYVCSNCLTLYCEDTEKLQESDCRTCKSKFSIDIDSQ